MDKIEEVTKILEKWFRDPIDKPCPYCEAASEIYLLIDAKIEYLKDDHETELQMLGKYCIDKCQQRVERIFKEIEANAGTELRGCGLFQAVMTEEEWQALKKQEGIE